MMACWSSLPEHLVEKFAEQLESPRDFLNFGAVCKLWHTVFKNNTHNFPHNYPISNYLPKGKPLPLLFIPCSGRNCYSLYSISSEKMLKVFPRCNAFALQNKVVYSSWRGWLLAVDIELQPVVDRNFILINPFTGAELPLPSLSLLQTSYPWTPNTNLGGKVKFALSSDPITDRENCVVLLTITPRFRGVCSCNIGDDTWKFLEHPHRIDDLTYYNGVLYAIDSTHCLHEISIANQLIWRRQILEWERHIIGKIYTLYLVESSDDLLLVAVLRNDLWWLHVNENPENFEIFKLVGCNHNLMYKWEEVEDISDQKIFIGNTGSISLESSLHPGLERNSIYYIDMDIHDVGRVIVHKLRRGSWESFSQYDENSSGRAIWLSPNLW